MAGLWDGIGAVLGKVTQWVPSRRESLNNTIDKLKKEMKDVQNKKPFDAKRYAALADKLQNAEALERRAS